MRSIEGISNGNGNGNGDENGLTRSASRRSALGKPTPSKWDDAQKWLVNLSRGDQKSLSKAPPRSSNADDRRLIALGPKDYDEGSVYTELCSGFNWEKNNEVNGVDQCDVETKMVDCDGESTWRVDSCKSVVRSICVRDMGTEMTPIGSQEPSRTATPIRAMTPVARSPVCSGRSTPVQFGDNDSCSSRVNNARESRAVAWDEAERAKYMARYKREQVKIQAWENHQKRKAEMQMKKVEVKAERLKSRAQEKYTNKLAASRRIAEEQRANAEAKLNEKAVKTSQRADYIRRMGHLPSSFSSFKFPSFCWYW